MVQVGQRLYQIRTRRKLTLDEIADATKIKPNFLAAIEKGEYHKLPSPAYAKGFVRNYADYLGLPRSEVTALFRREFDEKRAYKVLPDSMVTEEFPIKRMRIQQSLVMAAIVLGAFMLYLLFQYRHTFIPPSLSIDSPKEGAVISSTVTVTGKTDANATVFVNNAPATVNTSGEFMKQLALFPGKNTIVVKSKNRSGKETLLHREVTVK